MNDIKLYAVNQLDLNEFNSKSFSEKENISGPSWNPLLISVKLPALRDN